MERKKRKFNNKPNGNMRHINLDVCWTVKVFFHDILPNKKKVIHDQLPFTFLGNRWTKSSSPDHMWKTYLGILDPSFIMLYDETTITKWNRETNFRIQIATTKSYISWVIWRKYFFGLIKSMESWKRHWKNLFWRGSLKVVRLEFFLENSIMLSTR